MSGPFENRVESLLLERAGTVYMYHGTEHKNLKSILKKGLRYKGVPKRYTTANSPGTFTFPSIKTYGGVYLTNNVRVAYEASKDYDSPTIVVCQIQPRSLFADEDDVAPILDSNKDEYDIAELYLGLTSRPGCMFKDYQEKYRKYKDHFSLSAINKLANLLSVELHPKLVNQLYLVINKGCHLIIRRKAAYLSKLYTDWIKKDCPDFSLPKKSEVESAYRKWVDKVTRTLKILARAEFRKAAFKVNGRFLGDIKFHGRNRIVCIFQIKMTGFEKHEIKVLYGEPPEELKMELSKRFPGSFTYLD